MRREARGNGPGAIPVPRPGPTQPTWRVFAPRGGDGPAKWWLWVFIGPDTVTFVMDPGEQEPERVSAGATWQQIAARLGYKDRQAAQQRHQALARALTPSSQTRTRQPLPAKTSKKFCSNYR